MSHDWIRLRPAIQATTNRATMIAAPAPATSWEEHQGRNLSHGFSRLALGAAGCPCEAREISVMIKGKTPSSRQSTQAQAQGG